MSKLAHKNKIAFLGFFLFLFICVGSVLASNSSDPEALFTTDVKTPSLSTNIHNFFSALKRRVFGVSNNVIPVDSPEVEVASIPNPIISPTALASSPTITVVTNIPNKVSSKKINQVAKDSNLSDSTILAIIKRLLGQKEYQDLLRGPKGDSIQSTAMTTSQLVKNTTPIYSPAPIPSVFMPVGISQPNPVANFSGASFFNATDLSSRYFKTSEATIGSLSITGSSSLTGDLNIVGNINFSGTLMPGGLVGTAGQVLTSAGPGIAPTWETPSLFGLTDGSGTTANGTAVDLGGTMTSSALINTGGASFEVSSGTVGLLLYPGIHGTYYHSTVLGDFNVNGNGTLLRILDDASSVYFTDTNGDVKFGINNSAPTAALDVYGSANINSANGLIQLGDINNNSSQTNLTIDDVTPLAKLQSGSLGINIDHLAVSVGDIVGNGNGTKLVLDDSNNLSYFPSGNVGIGTTTPNSKLYIKDDTNFTSNNLTIENDYSIGGGAGLNIISSLNGVTQGTANIQVTGSNDLSIGSSNDLILNDTSGNRIRIGTGGGGGSVQTIFYQGNLSVGGVDTPGSRLVVKGSGTTSSTSSLNITDSSNNSRFFVRDDGNVGIGTSSPQTIFHIVDNNQSGFRLERTSATARKWDTYVSNSGSYGIYDSTSGGDRFTINTSGNVGIGTTSPYSTGTTSSSLMVAKNLASAGGYAVLGQTSAGSYGSVGGNYYLNDSGVLKRLIADSVSVIDFASGGFNFKASGNGAVDSSITLSTLWSISGSTGHFLAGTDNTYDIGASGATRPRTGYFGTSVIAPRFVTDANQVNLGGTATVLINAGASGAGYPGIGYNVDFLGTVNTYNYLNSDTAYMVGFGTGASGSDRMSFNVATAGTAGNPITFTEAMTIKNTGNIGIGTTSPGATLQVKGTDTSASTTGFDYINSSSEDIIKGTNDGTVTIGASGRTTYPLYVYGNSGLQMQVGNGRAYLPTSILSAVSGGMIIQPSGVVSGTTSVLRLVNNGQVIPGGTGSTNGKLLHIVGDFSNSANGSFSGSGIYDEFGQANATAGQTNTATGLQIAPTINNTAGTNVYRGIYYNPTLTSLIGTTHIAFENTTGNVLLGTTSGNVGIGTASPDSSYSLDVNGSVKALNSLRVWKNGAIGDIDLNLYNGQAGWQGGMYYHTESGGTNQRLTFYTGGVAGSGDKMTILQAGNVGIGTTSPGQKLEVNGNILVNKGTANRTTYVSDDGIYMSRTSDGSYTGSVVANTGGDLTFSSRNREDFVVNSVTSLTVDDTKIRLLAGTAATPSLAFPSDSWTGTGIFSPSTRALGFSTAGTERWDITSGGHFIATADNTYDIGASGATRPRTGYFGTSIIAPSAYFTPTVTTGTGATAGVQILANSLTSGNGLDVSSSSLTSGNLVSFSSNTSSLAASNTQTILNVSTSGANPINQTTYGGYFSNTHTGTNSFNIGLFSTASGGANNYAAKFDGTVLIVGSTTACLSFGLGSCGASDVYVLKNGTALTMQGSGQTTINVGGTSYFDAVGSKVRLFTSGGGEVLVNTSTDQGAFSFQVLGNTYLNPNVYANAVGGLTLARSVNFTGVAAETALDLSVKPSLTLTEPGSGTFTWNGGDIDMSSIAVTAGAGTTAINALRLAGISDADVGTSRGLFVANLTGTAATEEAIHTGTGWDYAAIFEAGYVGIQNTAPGYALHVGSSATTDATTLIRLEDTNSTCDFNANAGGPTCGSDLTLKKDIASLNTADLLTKISALNPVEYHWLTQDSLESLQYGFIAQEVEAQFPDLVTEHTWIDGTTKKFLNMGGLMPYVVGAVKELDIKVTGIENIDDAVPFTNNLRAWLANATNRITRIFTGEVCLTDADGTSECLNKNELHQLKQLLNAQAPQSVETPPPADNPPPVEPPPADNPPTDNPPTP